MSYLETGEAPEPDWHDEDPDVPQKMSANVDVYHGEAKPDFMRFASRRSVVHSTKGIVSCTQPLACRAGIKVLQQGGNAAVRPRNSSTNEADCRRTLLLRLLQH